MKLFFDLDGTLIDSRLRLYTLFCDLTDQSLLTFEDYWELKRNMYDHTAILKLFFSYSQYQIEEFQKKWLDLIEEPARLRCDTVFEFTIPTLQSLTKDGYSLYLLTARQSERNLIAELDKLGLSYFFEKILVTGTGKRKIDMFGSVNACLTRGDFIVGDTGIDIQAGKDAGLSTIAVLSGFRSAPFLKKYRPDYLLQNISEIYDVITK